MAATMVRDWSGKGRPSSISHIAKNPEMLSYGTYARTLERVQWKLFGKTVYY